MTPDPSELYSLLAQATELKLSERFEDAAGCYDRALRSDGLTEDLRLSVQVDFGHDLIMAGRHAEALANLGEVYAESRNQPGSVLLAFKAFYLQVDALYRLQEVLTNDAEDGLKRLVRLIDEGLQWLSDANRDEWRCTLLFLKSRVLCKLGEGEKALELAEISLREKARFDCLGFCEIDHALLVAKHARALGHTERAMQVLDSHQHQVSSGIDKIRFLALRTRLLRDLDPSDVWTALDEARRLPVRAEETHRTRDKLIAYGELALSAAAAGSRDECRDALKRVTELALEEKTLDRAWLLRKSKRYIEEVTQLLPTRGKSRAKAKPKYLAELSGEIDQALGEVKGDRS